MRLINTETLKIREFPENDTPFDYAILSHRWTDDETTYKDFHKGRHDSLGFRKVAKFCSVARSYGLEWAWADTACIDKRSSAELSEAINSMYRYYEDARLCFVLLTDVRADRDGHDVGRCPPNCLHFRNTMVEFRQSQWFQRGWTLQELIAPVNMIFYDKHWNIIGSKGDMSHIQKHAEKTTGEIIPAMPSVANNIYHATGIPKTVLRHEESVFGKSVASRLKYACGRETTRVEDMAYCLIGILQVNMPLLYGEGRRAWRRLQEEVIRTSNDESVFIWTGPNPYNSPLDKSVLAPRVWDFRDSIEVDLMTYGRIARGAYTVTNQGVELRLRAHTAAYIKYHAPFADITFMVMPLNCKRTTADCKHDYQPLVLLLQVMWCGHCSRIGVYNVQGDGEDADTQFELTFVKSCEEETICVHVFDTERSSSASCSPFYSNDMLDAAGAIVDMGITRLRALEVTGSKTPVS